VMSAAESGPDEARRDEAHRSEARRGEPGRDAADHGAGAHRGRWPLGICELAWPGLPTIDCAREAARLGFRHLDVVRAARPGAAELPIPVGAQFGTGPGDGWAWPAPGPRTDWEAAVAALRACPQPRVEPWAGSLFGSDAAVERLVDEVPGVRLVVDTGHAAQWGGDPVRFLALADHVQFRQAARGRGQLPPDDGDVDFGAVIAELTRLGYAGLISVEYFDLPRFGWPLANPVELAVALAERVRPLLAGS
jgi:sugar phosphate isomerase/epimerase